MCIASHRTGRIVFNKLSTTEGFHAIGLVRSEEKRLELEESLSDASNASVYVGDITDKESISKAFASDIHALVILTSAVPKMKMPPPEPPARPEFDFGLNGMPEQVGAENMLNLGTGFSFRFCCFHFEMSLPTTYQL